jgi:hypothetical protein
LIAFHQNGQQDAQAQAHDEQARYQLSKEAQKSLENFAEEI